jgi:hypothetical protein
MMQKEGSTQSMHDSPGENDGVQDIGPGAQPGPAVSSRVQAKIMELRRIETHLGHLPPDEWSLKDLVKRTAEERAAQSSLHARQLEQQTELLFGDICDELSLAGLTARQIADVINQQLRYEGGPRYCSEEEVKDVLGAGT